MTHAVLFDLDGTLVDSLPGIAEGVNTVLGTSYTRETIRPYVGPPLHDTLATLTGACGDELDGLVAEYRRVYAQIMIDGTRVFDGIPDALAALRATGVTLAVATSKTRPLAAALLDGLGLAAHFATVAGPVPPARDDKAVTIAQALTALGWPASATMIGDRHHDIDGARANGIRAIGVTWGFGTPEELAGADTLVDAPGELLEHT